MANDQRKIGILGGTFNPIHMGHLILAENARWQFSLDEVMVMPLNKPPHKSATPLIDDEHRIHMVNLAIQENPNFSLSTLEIEKEGYTYTVDTLKTLTMNYPNDKFYFIMGGDSIAAIERWKDPETIFQLAAIVVTKRKDMQEENTLQHIAYLTKRYGAEIYYLDSPRVDFSSSEIRDCVKNGRPYKYYVPTAVHEYIEVHNLYQ